MNKSLFAVAFLVMIGQGVRAQGDGPRNILWGPIGVTALNAKWMSLNQNVTPTNIYVKDAEIRIDVFPLTLIHNFNLGGHFAQIMLNGTPGSASGRVVPDPPGVVSPKVNASGWSDGFVGLKIGLVNQPALNVMEYAKHVHSTFSMMLYTRVWYPGTYDKSSPLNMGSNRMSFDFGLPMNIQLSRNPKRLTWWESYPALHFYAANNDPTVITQGNKLKQGMLFSFENHLSHNFSPKFWAGVTLRYQYGGAVKLDDVKNSETRINMLGTGATVGYQVLPILSLSAGYGFILAGDNGKQSNMLRIGAVLTYVNMKKLKAKAAPPVVAAAAPAPVDTDGDGVIDSQDKCPTQAGSPKYGGCPVPDTDGDGINDEQDKCPNQAGLAKYGGCPIPDTDGDGINDEQDRCPNQAGLPKYEGCPIPDSDGDGINDEEDKCPKTAGIAGNMGCPEMILRYKRADANLGADDKVRLDTVATFMRNNPSLNVIVEGHTSTLGATDYNQKLSEKRAANSVKYLVSKGIDANRLKAAGFGEQFPIGDNSKEEGRALSRRVVIKIEN
jgi:outer membrane protein OmpA-like peptidoglycan-associated protein